MRYRLIKEQSKQFHVKAMCKVMKVSASGYYQWAASAERDDAKEEALCQKVLKIFKDSGDSYGSRRICRTMRKECIHCSRRRICKIMKKLGIAPKRQRRFRITTDSNHGFHIYPNLLMRNFHVDAANKVWVSDLTYIWTDEGWLFLATVIDLYSRRVVGWSMSKSLESRIAQDALDMAVRSRHPKEGLIHHSDRGVQYACKAYQEMLKKHGMVCSMSKKGDPWDNSVAESFFCTLKKELVYRKKFATREQSRREIFNFIEVFYNRQRMHSYLGYRSPEEFEAEAVNAA